MNKRSVVAWKQGFEANVLERPETIGELGDLIEKTKKTKKDRS